ncbi:MAG: flavodoxin-dependent (E)-4-hydroxy-3-methylbut-2-enyl-diphosphate synthase [Candidatus Omnitrophota bacterium]|nr:flavodoxin-dependent (E)-4-hydroxy-3-methylbut-2-enyl-diphosphate synthase [Candidatus Omnitrophota bacterium]
MTDRKKTRQIKVGGVRIGGTASVSIQSMTKVDTSDVKAVIAQVKKLEEAGCEIVRVAVKDLEDAKAVRQIKKKIKIPIVCDIHFNYALALEAIRSGADKIRLNPGNLKKKAEVEDRGTYCSF